MVGGDGVLGNPHKERKSVPEGESLSEEQEGLSRTRSPGGIGTNTMQIQSHCITPEYAQESEYVLAGETDSLWAN